MTCKFEKKILSQVLWIGGPANSGKTTLARHIAKLKGYHHYSYDNTGREHLEKLAQISPKHEKYINSVLDEHLSGFTAAEIVEQSMEVSRMRFQFVINDIMALPNNMPILAEGVGFTPEILQPVISSRYQGVWLIPTEDIMEKSFKKKARFLKSRPGTQAETTINMLLQVNFRLMEIIKAQAEQYGYELFKIEETRSVEENAANIWTHFSQHIKEL